MKVFFYGLFMDTELLASKGIKAVDPEPGYADGFALRIGERATLVRQQGSRAWGVLMEIAPDDVTGLYAEQSVVDYRPETLNVNLMDGRRIEATCYNLPPDRVTGTNRHYAELLLAVAIDLGFPDDYLGQIRQAATEP